MFWRTKITGALLAWCMTLAVQAQSFKKTISFYGGDKNDLYLLLKEQGYTIKRYNNPEAAIRSAPAGSGVFLTADHYPEMDGRNRISEATGIQ